VAPVTISALHKIEPCILSPEVRRHLGGCLAAAYGQGDAASSLDHFADLLARLNAALANAQGSDELAFRSGLLEATSYLFRFAMSLTRDRTAAGDLVQDTMLRAWRSRCSFQAGTNLNAWLSTIMRNRFYTVRRKHTQEVADIDGDYAARLTSLPEQGGHLDLQDVQAALGRLSPPLREALMLVTLENVSYENAARIMNCQVGTVKSRVWRARRELASILGYTGGEIGADGAMLSALGRSSRVVEA
jgi:RNA polymerase sigma-70 factor (ECF subfamily)